jgi:hypothetical protein
LLVKVAGTLIDASCGAGFSVWELLLAAAIVLAT